MTTPLFELDITKLNDDELLGLYRTCANRMSYFNAAESTTHQQETAERLHARNRYNAVSAEIRARGLELPQGSWLL